MAAEEDKADDSNARDEGTEDLAEDVNDPAAVTAGEAPYFSADKPPNGTAKVGDDGMELPINFFTDILLWAVGDVVDLLRTTMPSSGAAIPKMTGPSLRSPSAGGTRPPSARSSSPSPKPP